MNSRKPTRILILGGGFGGVATAQGLSKLFKRDPSVEVTLVNRDNYFVFVPMLASAAAGSIEALHVVTPIRRLITGVQFRAEEVVGIDLEQRFITTASPVTARERELPYDHLVLALGNVINLSTLPGVAQHGKTIKTLGDALAIRNHVLQMLEAAAIETDPATRREMLTFVVAGGGFSGVEMVGELNDLVREAIEHYPSITEDQIRVILLHSQERILPEMAADTAGYALKQLRKRGVEARLNVRLAGATPREALLQDSSKIATRTLIVAVGNAPPPVLDGLDLKKEHGKIVVDGCMRVPDHPDVWALGDNAIVPNRASDTGDPSPPTAQYALRQGKTLARNIAATIRGRRPKLFEFGGLGLLCLVGHGAGVGELPLGIKVKGFTGWFLWRSVYWSKVPSFGRKVQIGADWLLDRFLKRDIAQINLARTQTVGRAHYEAGQYIFRQGEPGNHFYMVAEGEVEVIRERSSGEQNVLARLGKGEYFGETALLTQGRRNASVRCATPVDVVTIGRDDFATLAGAWVQLSERVKETSEQRVSAAPLTTFLPVLDLSDVPEVAPAEPEAPSTSTRRVAQLRRDSGDEVALDRDLTALGRSPDNHVVVQDPKTSRRHALIQREDDTYSIDDVGSQNGTRVNDDRITELVALKDGDAIRIGDAQFVFQIVTETVRHAPPSPPTQPEGMITGEIQRLDAAEGPAQPKVGRITGMIQSLDAPEQAPDRPEEPAAEVHDPAGQDAPPEEPAAAEPKPLEGSITGMIQGLDEAGKPAQPEADREPERPEEAGQDTGAIRDLDARERTPVEPEEPAAEDRSARPEAGQEQGEPSAFGSQRGAGSPMNAPAQPPVAPDSPAASSGEDRYARKGSIGSGRLDEVYLAHDEILDCDVALKVLKEQYADDEEFVERFKREAESAASLSHPNVVAVHDWGQIQDGSHYIVMEHVPGRTLEERLGHDGSLAPLEAAAVALQVAQALRVAHEQGVIHRDIKPQNVLLTEDGEAKVTDFGIARAAASSTITQEGMVLGTPHYVAPEQALGQPATPKSDLYSLGVVLYEMLTGEVPHDAKTPVEIVMKHVSGHLRPPKEVAPDVPEELNAVVVRLLARNPADRYRDATELIEHLDQVLPDAAEGSITGEIRSLDAADRSAQPEVDEESGRAPVEPEEPARSEVGQVTGMIQSLDEPERAAARPEEPEAEVRGPAGQDAPRESPPIVEPRALSNPQVLLRLISGPAKGKSFEVGQAGATIGRSPDNSIRLGDGKLSRRHARIEFKDGGYWLADLDSSYGTFVNEAPLSEPRRLSSGDVIELGTTRLSVTLEAGPAG